ncbi:MAG: hypothetical protein GY913_15470 [Proteobacteria bacterium]|nr:hypothetical protein [Pseudomonadota bacterium]MCP4918308.1 hypothetical protein [Pseudomonadota bacterium]
MNHVYLVPGFFGFANLGDFAYWGHVVRKLGDELPGWQIHPVVTRPTATLPQRAMRLLDAIEKTADPGDALHVVGHSTGGIDGRMLAAPGVVLPDGRTSEAVKGRMKTVVSVCTPHHGTPSAAFFATLQGKAALRALSLATVFSIRRGRVPLNILLKLGQVVTTTSRRLTGGAHGLSDELFQTLLGEFSEERRDAIAAFLSDVSDDRALLPQLTADSMQLVNATLPNHRQVRYGSVVARAAPPRLSSFVEAGLRPTAHAGRALYIGCWNLAGAWSAGPEPSVPHACVMLDTWGEVPGPGDNDAIVPTCSQPWGDLIRCVTGDHLDVLGHFAGPNLDPRHYDWLPSGSLFTDAHFQALWADVAQYLRA